MITNGNEGNFVVASPMPTSAQITVPIVASAYHRIGVQCYGDQSKQYSMLLPKK